MSSSKKPVADKEPAAAGSLRAKLIEKLAGAIEEDCEDADAAKALAEEIEDEINTRLSGKDYSAKGRSLVFNLSKNGDLRKNVVSRELTPSGLVMASTADLATEAQKLLRAESIEKYYAQRSLGQSDEHVVGWKAGTSGKLDWSHKYEKEKLDEQKKAKEAKAAGEDSTHGGGVMVDDDDDDDEDYEVIDDDEEGDTEPEDNHEEEKYEPSGGGGGKAGGGAAAAAKAGAAKLSDSTDDWFESGGSGSKGRSKSSLISPRVSSAAMAAKAAPASAADTSAPTYRSLGGSAVGSTTASPQRPKSNLAEYKSRRSSSSAAAKDDGLLSDLVVGVGSKRPRSGGGEDAVSAPMKKAALSSVADDHGEYGKCIVARCTLLEAVAGCPYPEDGGEAAVKAALGTVRQIAARAKAALA